MPSAAGAGALVALLPAVDERRAWALTSGGTASRLAVAASTRASQACLALLPRRWAKPNALILAGWYRCRTSLASARLGSAAFAPLQNKPAWIQFNHLD
jgi:hypothetical protein